MKDITTYCEKTIKSTNGSIKNTEATLRNLRENQEFLTLTKYAVKGNTNIIDPKVQHFRKTSKKKNIQEKPLTVLKNLELPHLAHTQHRLGKSPTRVPSTTKLHQPIERKKIKI